MIRSLLTSGILFLEWTETDNISGYRISITSGTVPQSVLDLGRNASYTYTNPSSYQTIGFAYTGYDYSGAAIISESKSFTLTTYVLSSATCCAYKTRSFISAKTNATISSLTFITPTGTTYGPVQYTGGTLITSSWLPKGMRAYAIDTNGRMSNMVNVSYASYVFDPVIESYIIPNYNDILTYNKTFVSTGAGSFYFTTGTMTSGAWLVVDSGNSYKQFFETIFINRGYGFVGKPFLMFVTDTGSARYIGTAFGHVFCHKKVLGATSNEYVAILPKFLRV